MKGRSYRVRVYELALENHGVVTTELAQHFGIPPVELRKLASRGAIERIGHGVYRSPFAKTTNASIAAEALAIAGSETFVCGASVLSLLEIGDLNPRQISVGHPDRLRKKLPAHIRPVRFSKATMPPIENYLDIPCESLESVIRGVKGKIPGDKFAEISKETAGFDLSRVIGFRS